jgi:eukaryotic-like serine/threonine-protein kinase
MDDEDDPLALGDLAAGLSGALARESGEDLASGATVEVAAGATTGATTDASPGDARRPRSSDLGKELLRASLKAELFGKAQEPTRIGRFVLLERLAVGGMGEVFTAYDEQLDREVAIKLVRPDRLAPPLEDSAGSAGGTASQRLLREAQTLARLSHPNVVQVYEAGIAADRVFLAMELIRGQSLRQWLAAQREVPAPRRWRAVLERFLSAGRGLQAAHAAGLVHRDFKPDNVLVGDDGRVCVADFGLARPQPRDPGTPDTRDTQDLGPVREPDEAAAATQAPLSSLTASGALLGTPAYMAPEQLRGEPSDARSDQFAFCVALYEALYGALPFVASDLAALHARMTSGAAIEAPRRTEVPSWIWGVLARGLAMAPADRYADMGALLGALEQRPARRRRRLLAGGCFGAGLIGALALWLTRPEERDPCALAGESVAALWTAERAATAAAAFAATRLPYAATSWPPLRDRVSAYVTALGEERRAACRATHVRREQSEHVLDLQTVCLDRREHQLASLAVQLVHADAITVAHAAEALAQLPRPDGCRDREALTFGVQPPADPEVAMKVRAARAQLAEVHMLRLAGHSARARQLLAEPLAASRQLGYAPLAAESRYQRGLLGRDSGTAAELEAAERDLDEAANLAEAANDNELLASIWSDLLLLGVRHHTGTDDEQKRTRAWANRALSSSKRLRDRGQQESIALSLVGALAFREGDLASAQRQQREAVLLAEQSGAPPILLANRLHALANTQQRVDGDAAAATYQRAFELLRDELGEDHPQAARLLYDRGTFLGSRGEFAPARALLEASLRAWDADHAPSIDAADTYYALGNLAYDEGQLERAAGYARQCAEMYQQVLEPESPQHAKLHTLIGLIAFRQERYAQALAAFERALAIVQRTAPNAALRLANLQSSVGETLAELGRYDDALKVLAEVDRSLARAGEVLPIFASLPLKGRGLALLGKGERRGAIAALEAALAALRAQPGYPLEVADVQWALARALIAKPDAAAPARALELARAAYQAYGERGEAGARPRAAIERWQRRFTTTP